MDYLTKYIDIINKSNLTEAQKEAFSNNFHNNNINQNFIYAGTTNFKLKKALSNNIEFLFENNYPLKIYNLMLRAKDLDFQEIKNFLTDKIRNFHSSFLDYKKIYSTLPKRTFF